MISRAIATIYCSPSKATNRAVTSIGIFRPSREISDVMQVRQDSGGCPRFFRMSSIHPAF